MREEPDGLSRLQRKLHSDIVEEKTEIMARLHDGINTIKHAASQGRVLIVFDNVNHESHREAIFEKRGWFSLGSKIIITTRALENVHTSCEANVVEKMNLVESLELFSWYAFGDGHPAGNYLDLSNVIVLMVIGSSLCGQTIYIMWENMTDSLKATIVLVKFP